MTPVAEVGWPLTSMLGASDGTLFDLADRSANSTVEVCETIAMIIGHRSLKLQQGERSIDVDVRIFAPKAETDGWSCRYEIDWPEGTRNGTAVGFDSLQALSFALTMIGAEIYTGNYHKSGLNVD